MKFKTFILILTLICVSAVAAWGLGTCIRKSNEDKNVSKVYEESL